MRIGIIGTGNMGRAIGVRFTRLGHDVVFGSRTAEPATEAAKLAGGNARAADNAATAAHGEVVVCTIRDADPAVLFGDPAALDGKIVIDLNNRDYAGEVRTGGWFVEAIAERLQARAPRARVVKALNLVAMEALDTSPEALQAAGAQLFIAGDDASAKGVVTGLLAELGFEAVDLGRGAVAMRAVEALGDVIRLLMIDAGKGGRANLRLIALPEPNLHSFGERQPSSYR